MKIFPMEIRSFILIILAIITICISCDEKNDWTKEYEISRNYHGEFKYVGFEDVRLSISSKRIIFYFEDEERIYEGKSFFSKKSYSSKFSQPSIICLDEYGIDCGEYVLLSYKLKKGVLLFKECMPGYEYETTCESIEFVKI